MYQLSRAIPSGDIKPATLALYEGLAGAVFGLVIAMTAYLQAGALGEVVYSTLLGKMLLGLSMGSLAWLPVIYFAVGALAGLAHATLHNAVIATAVPEAKRAADAGSAAAAPAGFRAARSTLIFGERIPRQSRKPRRQ